MYLQLPNSYSLHATPRTKLVATKKTSPRAHFDIGCAWSEALSVERWKIFADSISLSCMHDKTSVAFPSALQNFQQWLLFVVISLDSPQHLWASTELWLYRHATVSLPVQRQLAGCVCCVDICGPFWLYRLALTDSIENNIDIKSRRI